MKYLAAQLILVLCIFPNAMSQVSPAFKYQSIIRNSNDQVLANQAVSFRFSILKTSSSGTSVYTETQAAMTNQDGLVSLNIGEGLSSDSLSKVAWSTDKFFLKVELDPVGGTSYNLVGTSPILYVPMALYALNGPPGPKGDKGDQGIKGDSGVQGRQGPSGTTSWIDSAASVATLKKVGIGTLTPYGILTVQGSGSISDSALFTVKDKNGQPVFTVYETGVSITYNINPLSKGSRGGFTVGGRNATKGGLENILNMSTDSIRIYIDSTMSKGAKGGFVVGGRSGAKGSPDDYFSISNNSSSQIVNPSRPAILWYPSRNSFLTGQVLIESPDSVGANSFASGYESKSIGNFSQALGYKSIAQGTYSTAIGNYALALGSSSFALGTNAKALNINSYSFGNGAIASGEGSYAFGSQGLVYGTTNQYTPNYTSASGPNALAFGMGATASNAGSIAMGVNSYSSGWGSVAIGALDSAFSITGTAIGYACTVKNNHSNVAMGEYCTSSGYGSIALGWWAIASGPQSVAMGCAAKAYGTASSALGYFTQANGSYSTAIGRGNLGLYNSLFEVGNGTYTDWNPSFPKSNAFTILNNGNVGVNISNPSFILDVKGRTRVISDGSNTAGSWLTDYANSSNQAFIGMSDDNHVGLFGKISGWGIAMDVNTGKVGIGNITPSANLEVTVNGFDGYSGIAINSKITNGKYLTINQGTAGKLNFTSPGIIDLMTIDFVNNRVGVNTPNPTYPFQVSSSAYCTGSSWVNTSDKHLKENFAEVDGALILSKIEELPILIWNYKKENSSVRHIGPMAQDFYTEFGLGNDTTSISTIDPAGISLAAIKELDKRNGRVQIDILNLYSSLNKLQISSENKTAQMELLRIEQSRNDEQQKQIDKLENENENLKKQIAEFSAMREDISKMKSLLGISANK